MKICSIEGCERASSTRGWCRKHYIRWWETGDPLTPLKKQPINGDDYGAVVRLGMDRRGECLISRAKRGNHGYPRGANGKLAHRVIYEKWNGSIPDGMVVDHNCHNQVSVGGGCLGGKCDHKACINPAHLRAVPQLINAKSSPFFRGGKDQCENGHELSCANTYVRPSGRRECRECRKLVARVHGKMRRDRNKVTTP